MAKTCLVYRLGLIEYQEALQAQDRLLALGKAGAISDVLLLLQHPSVFTIGRSGSVKSLLVPEARLAREGISLFLTDRGGDITYHGPGQVVGYPILSLAEHGLNVHEYVWSLEELVIRTLADFGIAGERMSGRRGVWVGGEKICALGVRISRWVSIHGFALNVSTDLKYFGYIIPCGLDGVVATSMEKLGHRVGIGGVEDSLLEHFAALYNVELEHCEGFREWLDTLSPSGSGEALLTQRR